MLTMTVRISPEFNGLVTWRSRSDVNYCSACKQATNQFDLNLNCAVRPTVHHPISITSDGIYIASQKFLEAYHAQGLEGLAFIYCLYMYSFSYLVLLEAVGLSRLSLPC